MSRYYLYDEQTGAYLGCVEATIQPKNSTTIDPALTCHFNPYFENGRWLDKPLEYKPSIKQLLMQQSQQITLLQTMAMQQDQDNVKLQKANDEQASQIKQLQQMLMVADQQQAIKKAKEATQ